MQGSQSMVAYSHCDQTLESELRTWFCLFRQREELEACVQTGGWWFRANRMAGEEALRILSAIPHTEIFQVNDSQQLIPMGRTVPVGVLPGSLLWQPLSALSRLWLPACNASQNDGVTSGSVAFHWKRSSSYREPNALLCHFDDWRQFVMRNIKQRWGHLQFACLNRDIMTELELRVSETAVFYDTLIVGAPIPSIPGMRLRQESRILLPVEIQWNPIVSANVLLQAWNVDDEAWVLWSREDRVDVLSNDDFCWASRASVNATQINLSQEGR